MFGSTGAEDGDCLTLRKDKSASKIEACTNEDGLRTKMKWSRCEEVSQGLSPGECLLCAHRSPQDLL